MPFCTNCGTQVDSKAFFCHSCGARQKGSSGRQFNDVLNGISDRAACILCYIPVFGVIPAIVFLASQRFRTNFRVRFNAFQGLYLFVTWLIVSSAAPTLLFSGFSGHVVEHALLGLIKSALIVAWIYLLVKAAHEQEVRLPILGDLAARSTHEQL
jgi:uncharacterized membrane protein